MRNSTLSFGKSSTLPWGLTRGPFACVFDGILVSNDNVGLSVSVTKRKLIFSRPCPLNYLLRYVNFGRLIFNKKR
jgi:hypothetical protein